MDPAHKAALLEDFSAWLDVADLPAPDGAPAPDLFTLLAELAALKNEVRLESRHVKTALDEFRGLFEHLQTTHERLAAEQAHRQEQAQVIASQGQRALLLELLELRDRLAAGQALAAGFRARWFQRRAAAFVRALAAAMALDLDRLDATLGRVGVQPIPVLERPFDPDRMTAVECVQQPNRPDGLVVAEHRRGFLLAGHLLRAAEVVVNRCAPASSPDRPENPPHD